MKNLKDIITESDRDPKKIAEAAAKLIEKENRGLNQIIGELAYMVDYFMDATNELGTPVYESCYKELKAIRESIKVNTK